MLLVPSKLKSSQFYTYIYQAMQCDDFICLGIPFKCITNTACVRARLCKLQKGYTRLAAASDKVYQLLANGRWFSPDTPASSTTITGRHDIAEILLKVALKHKKSNQIKSEWKVRIVYIRGGSRISS